MEFSDFFKILKRHKLTLIVIPVITVIITYFLVHNQPDSYSSEARIATGIVDQTQQLLNNNNAQESQINQEFSNLTEMLRSKKMLDQLTYKLIIHDLTSDKPYRDPSPLFKELSTNEKQRAVSTLTSLYKTRDGLSLFNPDQNRLNKLVVSMHYDDQSILKTLQVYRVQNSDYITVHFDSENAELSAIVVNILCMEFIDYYTLLVKENQRKAVGFLGALLRAKEDSLNKRMANLKAYKIRNHVLNLNEKAKSIYGQMADFETRREEAQKNIQATQAAINNIDQQFNPADRKYLESSKIAVTQQLLSTRDELQAANDKYVQNNFDPKYKTRIDSLNKVVSTQLSQLSDKYVLNPMSTKKDLIDQKLGLQIQHQLAKHSTGSIDGELSRLYNEFNGLVPHEGTIQAYESAISVASQEYLEILQRYNQASMVSNFSTQLRLIERAEPGIALPSKKMLLVILSFIISFAFCIVVLFILFFFDHSIKNPHELANRTKIPVLGYLNLLKSKSIDLKDIWNGQTETDEFKQFRNLMQSIRFEVDNELASGKTLLINSITKAEGKTFLAINLAYAYASINKKVLLIDGNFNNPDITNSTQTKVYLEDFLKGSDDVSLLQANTRISLLGNKGHGRSLLEESDVQQIGLKLSALKTAFDVIIIEAPALETLNKSKEWTMFADKVITVFEAGKTISRTDREHIAYLKNLHDKFSGWILNTVNRDELTNLEST
jgi:Mrp family chromosome partitioning ATPase/uncharacterized protein involved in exopolysaccharide biosynthesis